MAQSKASEIDPIRRARMLGVEYNPGDVTTPDLSDFAVAASRIWWRVRSGYVESVIPCTPGDLRADSLRPGKGRPASISGSLLTFCFSGWKDSPW